MDWGFLFFKKTCFQGSHSVYVGEDVRWWWWCVGGSVNEVLMEVTGCVGGCAGGGGCVFGAGLLPGSIGGRGWGTPKTWTFWTQKVDFLNLTPLTLLQTIFAHFVTKSGPFAGKFGGGSASHPPTPHPRLRAWFGVCVDGWVSFGQGA